MYKNTLEAKLKQRKPNATFYPSFIEVYKGEFPLLYEEFFKDGVNIDSIRKFTAYQDGVDPELFIIYAGFFHSAKGYHHYTSKEANLIDSE